MLLANESRIFQWEYGSEIFCVVGYCELLVANDIGTGGKVTFILPKSIKEHYWSSCQRREYSYLLVLNRMAH